MYTHGEQLRA